MRNRIRPKTKRKHQKAIRDIIKGLSRKVLIYKQPLKSECPNCYYDKLTNRSTGKCKWTLEEANQKQLEWEASNPSAAPDDCETITVSNLRYKWFQYGRCPVCFGAGYLETKRKSWADCLVIWNPRARPGGNEMVYTPAGTEGSTIVELKTNPKYFDLFKNCDYIVVDGVNCKISRPPILRGLGVQAVLIIIAFTTDKPSVDSDEVIKEYI